MADNNTFFGKGIPLASGFDLGAKAPLDSRLVVNDIAERDAHVTGNRAYTGLIVYVISEQKNYQFNGTEWVEFGVFDTEDIHTHENKELLDSLTQDKVAAWDAKSDFSGDYNDLENKPVIPSIEGLASEDFVANKLAELVNSAPEALDTLNELAKALGEDPNFATTINNTLAEKANKNELHNHDNKSVLDGIDANKVAAWDAKSDFSGDYNDLENKPVIPSIDGLATEDFVLEKINEIPKIDLTPYALKEELFSGNYEDLTNKPVIPSIEGLASQDFVKAEIAKAQLEGEEVDLTGYATKDELNSLVGDISILQGQAHTHANIDVLEGLTAAKIAEWDAKPTKKYVDDELANKLDIDAAIIAYDVYGDGEYEDIPM